MRIVHPDEVKSMRSKADLTQSELAEAAGVSQAYIAKIESGDADPKISTLEKISGAISEASSPEVIKAEDIMEEPIVSVGSKDDIQRAIRLMEDYDISQLPVIEEDGQVGSLSEETILHKISAGENMFKLVEENVENVMEEPFPTVGAEEDLDTIFHLLENNHAVLVFEEGEPRGIITKADMLQLSTGRPD